MSEVLIVFDLETTGKECAAGDCIIEVGAVPIIDGKLREDCSFHALVDPDRPIPADAIRVHGITDDMVRGKPRIEVVLPEFLRYCGPHPVVAQNSEFDLGFLRSASRQLEVKYAERRVHDTMLLSRQLHPGERRHALDDICRRLKVEVGGRHRSIDDVLLTGRCFLLLRERLVERGTWDD